MPLIDPFSPPSCSDHRDWIYNGLDSMATWEVHQVLAPQLDPVTAAMYNFEMALRAPALEMSLRGMRLDLTQRDSLRRRLGAQLARLTWILDQYVPGLNPNSPKQLKEYFYGTLKLPHQYKFAKGVRTISTDRNTLEKLSWHLYARPVALAVLAARDVVKKLSTINAKLDADLRFRSTFNPAGTETGRWSSSGSAFRTGGNMQNQTEELRSMFIADPGMKLCYADLEHAESYAVAHISADAAYIEACTCSDIHTAVAQMVWPKKDLSTRARADAMFYRGFSYRDIAKRAGHATNYRGTAHTLAKILHVPEPLMEQFQTAYFQAFPGIPQWHAQVAKDLQTTHTITTLAGRRRRFFNRAYDAATLREAIAYNPQSTVADVLNLGLYRLWSAKIPGLELLAQVHDAVLFQYPEGSEAAVLAQVAPLLTVPLGAMTIPVELSVGWNWQHASSTNPDGIVPYHGSDPRTKTKLLDRIVC